MMHYNNTVVSILDSTNKAFREHNSTKDGYGRTSEVIIPFDSEYKLLIKNLNGIRLKMDATIDGVSISSNSLVINGNDSLVLDCFPDSLRKFKFVSISNENVSDPTNSENGKICINLTYEKIEPVKFEPKPLWKRDSQQWNNSIHERRINLDNIHDYTHQVYSQDSVFQPLGDVGLNSNVGALNTSYYNNFPNATLCSYSAGATVEGGLSDQKFIETKWHGDSLNKTTFIFKLKGPNNSKEYQEYLRLQKIYG